ncbi:MAG: B12-binding domain-containing radical SAM protein [Desulfobacteraceae bacterium]|nr:B12-binding domain-containing radical SAM protein [Desulfobacteraceae bacterium]
MRVLLINPHYPLSETPSPPLGLAYLAAALRCASIPVRVLDFVVMPGTQQRLAAAVEDFQPNVVGVTAVSMNAHRALDLVRRVKALDPAIRTVMGGPHVSFRAEETLAENPDLDAVVIGEGEAAFTEMIERLEAGRSLHSVAGIVFRSGGRIHRTRQRPRIANLDELADPARDLLPLGRYRALHLPVSMTTSRGCPHRCIFCLGRKMVGARVRYRSPKRVVDEMAKLAQFGFHQINIADDLFTASPRHCRAVCDELRVRDLSVPWTAFARVDSVTETRLRRMRDAGCTAVSFGVESGSDAVLRTARKGITCKQVMDAVKACRRAGIAPHASFLLGLPGETPETLEETLAFGRRLEEEGVAYGFHLLAPFPGTDVREQAESLGIRILTDDWSRYDANRAVVETETASAQDLDAIVADWEERFLQWLGEVDDRRRSGTASAPERAQLENLEQTVVVYDLMMAEFLENRPPLPLGGAPPTPEEELQRLGVEGARVLRRPADEVLGALETAYRRGDLLNRRRNGRRVWQWRDRIE